MNSKNEQTAEYLITVAHYQKNTKRPPNFQNMLL
jgi:hypothetical protein